MSEKYKREIEEILRQAGERPAGRSKRTSRRSLLRSMWAPLDSPGGKKWRISPGRIALTAITVLLAAIVLRYLVPIAATPLFWLALLLFIVAYAFFLARPQAYERRWRGHVMSSNKVSFGDRVRKWLKK